MMDLTQQAVEKVKNLLRARAIVVSRHYKRLFAPEGALGRDAEIVIADLREFSKLNEGGFSTDPLVMARNAGRREVVQRVIYFLGLDEAEVAKMMEVDYE